MRRKNLSIAMKLCGALASIVAAQPLFAQPDTLQNDREGLRVGIYGASQIVTHDTKVVGVPGIPTCSPGFDGGGGSGSAFGGFFQYGFSDLLGAQLRLGYSTSNGTLTVQENIGNVVQNGEVISAFSEHSIDLELAMVDIEPSLVITPLDIPLTINVGVQFGSILTKNYEQKETLISPSFITFGGGTVRNLYKRELPNATSLYVGMLLGVGYDIPVTRRIALGPEISYRRGISELLTDTVWKVHAFRFGASLKVRLGALPELPPEPIPEPEAVLDATVTASGLMPDNAEQPIARMRVEEFLTAQLRPLLNYVFFDEGAAELPDRYVKLTQGQAASFRTGSLGNAGVLPTYYQILNVVGRRMQEHPNAALTLVGCNSDIGIEKGNVDLSRRRAETVRDYLRDMWGIAEERIVIEARDLPEKPSNTSDPDGVVENRRVELRSDDPAILEPVFTGDTLRTSNPPRIRFRTDMTMPGKVTRWRLVASQGGRMLKEFSGNGAVPQVIDWNVESDQATMPRGTQPIEYRMEVTDAAGKSYTTKSGSLAVDQVTVQRKRQERLADKEVDRYSLILFDFGKSDISGANRRIVDFIKGRIDANAEVQVTGHTDRVGEADYNQKLSEERAAATAKSLGVAGAAVRGLGESELLYDNELPEGRFYCRVVNVVVEKKVNE